MKFHPKIIEQERFGEIKNLLLSFNDSFTPFELVQILTFRYRMQLKLFLKKKYDII